MSGGHMYTVQLSDLPERIIAAKSKKDAIYEYVKFLRYEYLEAVRYDVKKAEQIGIRVRKLAGLYI